MCLQIKRKKLDFFLRFKRCKAKNNIICYKIYDVLPSGKVQSIQQCTIHDIGIPLSKVKFTSDKNNHCWSIFAGYHSFTEKPEKYTSYKIFECIIPEGSYYYKGGINSTDKIDGYVSNSLIIIKQIE